MQVTHILLSCAPKLLKKNTGIQHVQEPDNYVNLFICFSRKMLMYFNHGQAEKYIYGSSQCRK